MDFILSVYSMFKRDDIEGNSQVDSIYFDLKIAFGRLDDSIQFKKLGNLALQMNFCRESRLTSKSENKQ